MKVIRTKIAQDGSKADISTVQLALQKAENELKNKSDTLINNLNNEVRMLPPLDKKELISVNQLVQPETFWNNDRTSKFSDSNKQLKKANESSVSMNSHEKPRLSIDYTININKNDNSNTNEEILSLPPAIKSVNNDSSSPGQNYKQLIPEIHFLFLMHILTTSARWQGKTVPG